MLLVSDKISTRAQESTDDKNINHGKLASLKSADHEIWVRRSWLLYIPTGVLGIHPYMKYQLAIIN